MHCRQILYQGVAWRYVKSVHERWYNQNCECEIGVADRKQGGNGGGSKDGGFKLGAGGLGAVAVLAVVVWGLFGFYQVDQQERAVVDHIEGDMAPALKRGDVVLRVDPRYFRPAEVETLLGDPTKAKEKLGWVPLISAQRMCAEMVGEDLAIARRHALLRAHGHEVAVPVE